MRSLIPSLLLLLTGACATSFERPENTADMNGGGYAAERQSMSGIDEDDNNPTATTRNMERCHSESVITTDSPQTVFNGDQLLSPGDLLRIEIARGDEFQGDYIVAQNGSVRLPFLGNVPAAGLPLSEVEKNISSLLASKGYFKASFIQTSASVLQLAPVQVGVSGAVFQSGDVLLNQKQANSDPEARLNAIGDFTLRRSLSTALYNAAGIRPDADLRNVTIIRQGQRQVFDMSGALDGSAMNDPILIAGDQVYVPSRGCFQTDLARPSRITPPGIRIFISNLTRPSASNAAAAINQHATELPYGTRFLRALVSANCVGGIQATNADRWGVLISRNPITGESEVVTRSIEDLVRRSDRDDFNPVLLPNDAIACYDSHQTNVRDMLAMISETAAPFLNAAVLGGLIQ